jgi:hypothetical protein
MWKRIRNPAIAVTKTICFGAVLVLTALAARGAPAAKNCVPPSAQCAPACPVPQSPRNINPALGVYNGTSTVSRVVVAPDERSLVYSYTEGGRPVVKTLYRCSRHYHCPIEDPQGCSGDDRPPVACTESPRAGQWIEVHAAYAARVTPEADCRDPQGLTCCLEGPVVVRGFSALVGNGAVTSGRLAEWSGSDTDPSEACRETAAFWSFQLGCGFKVGLAQLDGLKAKAPRRVQGGLRVSNDLTLVTPR